MPDAELLTDAEVADGVARLTDWRRDGDTIVRTVNCRGFRRAIELVDRVAELAVAANHHPDIAVHGYKHVTFTLTTHAARGITRRDLDLAAQIDAQTADLLGASGGPEAQARG